MERKLPISPKVSYNNPRCVCQNCRQTFDYRELIIKPSWNGKWDRYLTPCCEVEEWCDCRDYEDNFIMFNN